MNKEMALVHVDKGIFAKLTKIIKGIFSKFNKEKNVLKAENIKEIDDFECLKGIVQGKISIKELNIEQKKRLILLCDERTKSINNKIDDTKLKIKKIDEMLNKIEHMQGK